jgi:hypothetical protein
MIPTIRLACFAFAACALRPPEALACSILNVTTGDTVIVGRNHDWFDETHSGAVRVRYLLEFVPGAGGKHGAFVATSALNGFHIVFEGMNDAGLFVGLTATPKIPVAPDTRKPPVNSSDLVRLLLEEATTVDDALAEVRKYSLQDVGSAPSGSHFMIVDAKGKSVVLEYVGDELRVVPKVGAHQHMTNAYVTPVKLELTPPWASDGRFARAKELLEAGRGRSVDDAFGVLRELVMSDVSWATQYALVYDLRARTVALAADRRWDRRTTFRLDDELARGLHSIATQSLTEPPRARASTAALGGAAVVTSVDGELYRLGGGAAPDVQLTALAFDFNVACAADGRLAFARLLATAPFGLDGWRAALYTVRQDGSGLRQLTDGEKGDMIPVWPRRATGELFFGRLNARTRWEIYRTRVDARPRQEQIVSDYYQSERLFTAMRDGRLLLESDREPGFPLYALTPRKGKTEARYDRVEIRFPVIGRIDKLALSPDETQALFEMGPGGGPKFQRKGQVTYTARFDAAALALSDARPLGPASEGMYWARWGKDGGVFYLSDRGGKNQLYRKDLATGAETRVTEDETAAHESFCFPGVVN